MQKYIQIKKKWLKKIPIHFATKTTNTSVFFHRSQMRHTILNWNLLWFYLNYQFKFTKINRNKKLKTLRKEYYNFFNKTNINKNINQLKIFNVIFTINAKFAENKLCKNFKITTLLWLWNFINFVNIKIYEIQKLVYSLNSWKFVCILVLLNNSNLQGFNICIITPFFSLLFSKTITNENAEKKINKLNAINTNFKSLYNKYVYQNFTYTNRQNLIKKNYAVLIFYWVFFNIFIRISYRFIDVFATTIIFFYEQNALKNKKFINNYNSVSIKQKIFESFYRFCGMLELRYKNTKEYCKCIYTNGFKFFIVVFLENRLNWVFINYLTREQSIWNTLFTKNNIKIKPNNFKISWSFCFCLCFTFFIFFVLYSLFIFIIITGIYAIIKKKIFNTLPNMLIDKNIGGVWWGYTIGELSNVLFKRFSTSASTPQIIAPFNNDRFTKQYEFHKTLNLSDEFWKYKINEADRFFCHLSLYPTNKFFATVTFTTKKYTLNKNNWFVGNHINFNEDYYGKNINQFISIRNAGVFKPEFPFLQRLQMNNKIKIPELLIKHVIELLKNTNTQEIEINGVFQLNTHGNIEFVNKLQILKENDLTKYFYSNTENTLMMKENFDFCPIRNLGFDKKTNEIFPLNKQTKTKILQAPFLPFYDLNKNKKIFYKNKAEISKYFWNYNRSLQFPNEYIYHQQTDSILAVEFIDANGTLKENNNIKILITPNFVTQDIPMRNRLIEKSIASEQYNKNYPLKIINGSSYNITENIHKFAYKDNTIQKIKDITDLDNIE